MVKASGCTKLSYPNIYLAKQPRIRLEDGSMSPKLKPVLTIDGELNKRLIFEELAILENGMHANISHEDEYAVAMVTLETSINLYIS